MFIFAACRMKFSIDCFVLVIALSVIYFWDVYIIHDCLSHIFRFPSSILSLINLREIKRWNTGHLHISISRGSYLFLTKGRNCLILC